MVRRTILVRFYRIRMLAKVMTRPWPVPQNYSLETCGLIPSKMTRSLRLSKTGLVGCIVFVLLLTVMPLTDPDYFWHLKTGEYIVAQRALPAGDVFSFTRAGQPWVLHEWLFEVGLYGAFAAGGERGVVLLTVTLALGALALAFAAARRVARSAGAAWIATSAGALAFAGGVAARPQLVTYLCFAFTLSALLAFKYADRTRALFALPFVMVVWVNAHGAYAIGVALMLLFAGCEWLAWAMRPVRDAGQKRRLVRLTQATVLVVLASLANPGVFERWLYPFQVLGMAVNEFIQEWQSPNFHEFGPKAFLGLALLYFVSSTYAVRKPDLTELALPLVFTVQGCISMRHVPLAALVLVPFTALALARGPLAALDGAVRGVRPVRWYLARRGAAGPDLGAKEFVLNWALALAFAACFPAWVHRHQPGSAGRTGASVPAKGAADFVEAHRIGGKLFNQYADGGYLIYRLAPQARVVVDGRADVYGDRFIKDYLDVYQGAADWQAKFERLGADLAVLPLDAPIRQLLLAHTPFREVYRDKHYSVLQRAPANQEGGGHGITD
jgi:hypothetical protein